jgi:hypothetical protein
MITLLATYVVVYIIESISIFLSTPEPFMGLPFVFALPVQLLIYHHCVETVLRPFLLMPCLSAESGAMQKFQHIFSLVDENRND